MGVHRGTRRNAILQCMLGSDGEDASQGQRATETQTPSSRSIIQSLTQCNKFDLEILENAEATSQATHQSELQINRQCLSEQAFKLTTLEARIIETREALAKLQAEVRGIKCQQAPPADQLEREERRCEASSNMLSSEANVAVPQQKAPCQSAVLNRLNKEVNSVQGRADPEANVSDYEEKIKTLFARFQKRENLSDIEHEVIGKFLEHFKRSYNREILMGQNTIKGHEITIRKLNEHVSQLQTLLEGRLETVKTANSALARSSSLDVLCMSPPPPQQEPGRKTPQTTAPIPPRASPHASAPQIEVVSCRSSTVNGSGFSRPATIPSKLADGPTSSCMKGQEAVSARMRGTKRPFGQVEIDGMIEDEKRSIVRSKGTR